MKKINLRAILTTNLFILLSLVFFIPFEASAQCVNEQFNVATLSENDFGQSFTIPAGGCGSLTNLVIERLNGGSGNLNAITATFELFVGQTVAGSPQYTQSGITISAGVGDKTITLSGGIGSLAVTPGTQYTWYLTLSAHTDWRLGDGSAGESYTGGQTYALSTFLSGFDIDMTINSTSPPLPVELISFDVKKENSAVILNWETASEKNNEGFQIERSADGEKWETLDFVIGNGTTQEMSSYQYLDNNPLEGTNYYRFKQIDFDGQFEYSHIVNAEFKIGNDVLKLFPSPVNDELNIVNGVGQVKIFNTLGQLVKQFSNDNEQTVVNVNDLPKGQYILQIQKQNGTVKTQQFMK